MNPNTSYARPGEMSPYRSAGGYPSMSQMPARPVQLNEGGMAGFAGHPNYSQPMNRENVNAQANSIRNSYDHNNNFNNNNINQGNTYNRYVAPGAYGGGAYGYHPYGAYGAYGYHPYGGYGYHPYWGGYPGSWYPSGWSAATAWTCAGTAALGGLLGISLASLGSGNGGGGCNGPTNVTYQGDTVIVNGQPSCSADQYYQQAQQLAQQAMLPPPVTSDIAPDQWQPLGVFCLAQPGQTQSAMMVQLAINQNGVVRGNYLNQITGESSQVSGALDKTTQRISWIIGDNQNTVFDTNLQSLLQQQTTVLVHYGAQNTQQMLLVRVPEPSGGAGGGAPAAATS
jgi:hypothetical protein